jgi:hypothetical protein
MDPDIHKQLHALFDAYDRAVAGLRVANKAMADAIRSHDDTFDAYDKGIGALRAANKAMGGAIQAHDDAIQAVVDANRAALALLARLQDGASS